MEMTILRSHGVHLEDGSKSTRVLRTGDGKQEGSLAGGNSIESDPTDIIKQVKESKADRQWEHPDRIPGDAC